MPDKNLFVSDILDMLQDLGAMSARAMFGGHGIYHRGLIVALADEGTLYIKVDAANRAEFEAAGCRPFEYLHKQKGTPVQMSYWTVPPEALEEPRALQKWVIKGYEAAQRSAAGKKK